MQKFLQFTNKLELLRNDFVGISFNLDGFIYFLKLILTALFIFLMFYLIGRIIQSKILHICIGQRFINTLCNIATGYIFFGTAIAVLGVFSLLTNLFISIYLLSIVIICIFSFSELKNLKEIIIGFKEGFKTYLRRHFKIAILVMLLTIITFLRLIPPETGADAMEYHTSYPRFYLKSHSMMVRPIATEGVTMVPQLGEMTYLMTEFIGIRDASRFIHYGFYLLIVAILSYIGFSKKGHKFRYASLIFAGSPLVLHIAPSAYGDMPATFLFLLSVVSLVSEKKPDNKIILLSGLLFGGFLASKIWALAFLPIFVTYLAVNPWRLNEKGRSKRILTFIIISLFVSMLWYIRSFILTGNPLYFNQNVDPELVIYKKFFPYDVFSTVFDFQSKFRIGLLFYYGPMFLLGFLTILYKPIKILRNNLSSPYWVFTFIMIVVYFFLPHSMYDPRYLLPLFSILTLSLSIGLNEFTLTNNLFKFIMRSTIILIIGYYSINSFIGVFYGFGWANTENYLTRYHTSINRDVSYYDFDKKFSKFINKNDKVATYGINMYYYADFDYQHVFYFFKEKRMLKQLKAANVSKLLIRGGDIKWFCDQLQVLDCNKAKYKELANYKLAKQYLYEIE